MSVSRNDAITGELIDLQIVFREDDTNILFDPYSIEQVDILLADGITVVQTIPSGSITKVSLGTFKITVSAISNAGIIIDRWYYRLEDGGVIKTANEVTNISSAPAHITSVESNIAVPRSSAVVLRPILLNMEFRDDQTGELFDPYEVRQVEILENDGSTIIETITSITRIGLGKFRIQASAVSTTKTILDKWYFTATDGEPERYHLQDTQVYDQAALGGALETISVPEKLYADVGPHDSEVVLVDRVENIGITFRDSSNNLINPAVLSLDVTDVNGCPILSDIYLPLASRDPDPPRIINPYDGRFEFPFGLDNSNSDTTKKNRTEYRRDYVFTWFASSREAIRATVTIDPGVNPDSELVWTAVPYGTPGNFISVEYVDPGTANASLTITRNGSEITVSLATNFALAITTTPSDIITAVAADDEVSEIVTTSLPTGATGTGIVDVVTRTNLSSGIDSVEELVSNIQVRVITHRMWSLINHLRLQIDKAVKHVSYSDPDDPCFLGYTDGQLITFLENGLHIINAYQPSGCFSFDNYPYSCYEFLLIESSLLAGVMSQEVFAIDTDIPSWNDQGNTFVIQHQPQLAQYLTFLSQRLDKMIPMMKLNFVNLGGIHIEAGPNFRLVQLINAAPNGALFRNVYFRG